MLATSLLLISILFQFIAVFLAVRLIRITGRRTGWALIAAAISLITVRLMMTLFNFLSGEESPPSLLNEVIALATSALITVGIAAITSLYLSMKQSEEAIRRSHEKYRTLFDSIDGIVWEADARTFQFNYVSKQGERLLGYPVERWIAEPGFFKDHLHPDDREMVSAFFTRVVREKKSRDLECRMLADDGREIWLKNIVSVTVENDKAVRLQGVMINITEQKRIEESLRQSEERFRLVTRATNDVMSDWNIVTNTLWWNENLKTLFGYKDEEIESGVESWINRIHPEDKERVLSVQNAAVNRREEFFSIEYRFRRADGSHAMVFDRSCLVYNQHGRPLRKVNAMMDITGRKQAEEALKEAEARLRLALQAGRIGTWDWNLTTGKIVWSSRHEALWEMAPRTFKGTYEEFEARLHPDDRDGVKRATARAIAEHSNLRIEYRVVWSDGSVHWIAGQGEALFDESGRPVRMIGVVMDITERKQAEEALRKSEERFQLASRATNDAIWDWDLVTNAVRWNERFQTLFGYQPEEIESGVESWTNRIHPEDKGWVLSEVDAAIKQGRQFWSGEYRFRRGDGSYAAVFDRGYVVHDENGRPVRMIGAMLDITERKRAEEALRRSERHLRDVMNSLIFFAGVLTPEGIFVEANQTALNATGLRLEEVIGKPFDQIYAWSYSPEAQAKLRDAIARAARGETVRYDTPLRLKGDRFIMIDFGMAPMFDAEGKVTYLVPSGVDITERKRAEEEIKKLNLDLERRVAERTAQLEAANKELESFSYSVSHDLRAPLRGISGFSRVLLTRYADRLDAQGKDFLQRVDAASRRMGELIEDLLNLSRVTRSEIRKEPVDLTLLARSIAEDLQSSDPKRRVTFLIQEGLKASADPHLLRIVLENLLGNAWKFTSKHSTATIELGRLEQNEKPVYFVRDDGAGFDMAYADKLFGPFQRLHNLNEFAGTGVGLASVQRIIRRHGGKVWAEGAVEKGATFYFTL